MNLYQLAEDGCVRRLSDGALIPPAADNGDWIAFQAWRADGNEPDPAPARGFDAAAVAAECQRRIYAVASQNCQMNMTAWVASGQAGEADRAAFASALAWVQSMRAAYARLVAGADMSFADDARWPACPAEASALAARF